MNDKRVIVMLGTDMRSPGGMTAVVHSYQQAGLFEQWPLRYLPTFHLKTTPNRLWMAARALLLFLILLLRGRVQAVHAHAAAHGSFWRKSVFLMLAHLAGKPTLLHLHSGEFPAWYAQSLPSFAQALVRAVLRRVDRVLVLGDVWAREIGAIEPAARLRVLRNPVVIPARRAQAQAGRVLFMARLWPEKGVEELMLAMAELAPRHAALQLVCAGDGDLQGLRRRAEVLGIAERVSLTGWIDGEAKQRELMQAAVFVLPSWFEGLPIGVLEAMAAAVPVVASDVGAMAEALGAEEAGLLLPARDAAALARALGQLLDHPELAARLGEQGRQRAERLFAAPAIVTALGQIYRELGLRPRQTEGAA